MFGNSLLHCLLLKRIRKQVYFHFEGISCQLKLPAIWRKQQPISVFKNVKCSEIKFFNSLFKSSGRFCVSSRSSLQCGKDVKLGSELWRRCYYKDIFSRKPFIVSYVSKYFSVLAVSNSKGWLIQRSLINTPSGGYIYHL